MFADEAAARAWLARAGDTDATVTREVAVDASFYDGEWGEVRDTRWCEDMLEDAVF